MGEVLTFSVALTDCGLSLIIAAYFLITLSDLECDYLNASSCCSKLNRLVIPEIVFQSLSLFFLAISFHYWLVLVNLPLFLFVINKYVGIPSYSIGLYDPSEIHNRRQLQRHMKEAIIKIVYYCIFFLLYLYCLVYSFFTTISES